MPEPNKIDFGLDDLFVEERKDRYGIVTKNFITNTYAPNTTTQKRSSIEDIITATKNKNFNEEKMLQDARRKQVPIDPVTQGIVKGAFNPIGSAMGELDTSMQEFGKGKVGEGSIDLIKGLLHSVMTPFTVPYGGITEGLNETGQVGKDITTGLNQTMNLPFDVIKGGSELTKQGLDAIGINTGDETDLGKKANDLLSEIGGLFLLGKGHRTAKGYVEGQAPLPTFTKGGEVPPTAPTEAQFRTKPNQTVPLEGLTQERTPLDLAKELLNENRKVTETPVKETAPVKTSTKTKEVKQTVEGNAGVKKIKTVSSEDVGDRIFVPEDSYTRHNFKNYKIPYYQDLLDGKIKRDGKTVVLTPEHKTYIESEIKRLEKFPDKELPPTEQVKPTETKVESKSIPNYLTEEQANKVAEKLGLDKDKGLPDAPANIDVIYQKEFEKYPIVKAIKEVLGKEKLQPKVEKQPYENEGKITSHPDYPELGEKLGVSKGKQEIEVSKIKESAFNNLQWTDETPTQKRQQLKQAQKDAEQLRRQGIDAKITRKNSSKGWNLLIDGKPQGKRELGLVERPEKGNLEDVKVSPEVEKPFKNKQEQTETLKVAEAFTSSEDLPTGFGKKAHEKAIEDIRKDEGAETNPEAKIIRDKVNTILKEGTEIKQIKGSSNTEQLTPEQIKEYVNEKPLEEFQSEPLINGDRFIDKQGRTGTIEEYNPDLPGYEKSARVKFDGGKELYISKAKLKKEEFDLTAPETKVRKKKPEQLKMEGLGQAKMPDKPITGTGKGEETTPLFNQKTENKNQGNMFGSPGAQPIKQLQTKSNIRSEFKESDLNEVTRLRSIGKSLSQNIDLTTGQEVRTGTRILRRFGKMAGYYFPSSGLIRIKNINDVGVLAHEIGHKLHFELFDKELNSRRFDKTNKLEGTITRANGIKDAKRRDKIFETLRNKYGKDNVDSLLDRAMLRKELKDFGSSLGKYYEKFEESIAEFISRYVTDPEMVRQKAPKFNDLFESLLDQNPQVRTALLDARKQIKEFQSQDPRQITESTIARDTETDSFLSTIKKGAKDFYFNVIDGSEPFRKLEKQLKEINPKLEGKDNPLQQVLSLIGVDGKAKQFLENHPFKKSGNDIEILKDRKPFLDIFGKMLKDGNLKSHEGYLTALRNIELIKNSKSEAATTSKEIAEKTVKLYEEQLGKDYLDNLVNDLREYNNALLEYYTDSGKISFEQLKQIKELNQYYVPFKRFFDEWETNGQMPNVSKYVKDSAPSPVKTIRGSQREIVSPISSIIKNTYDMIAAADRNTSLKTIVQSLKAVDKTLVQEIPARTFKRVNVIAEADKILDPATGDILISPPKKFTEQKTAVMYEKPQNAEIVTVYNEGKPTYYQIPKEYYDSFFTVNEQVSKAIRIFSIPSRVLQAGAVVYDPTFAVRNVPRDQVSAMFYTKYGYNPIDFVKGIFASVGKSDAYQKFLASGSDQSFLTAMDKMLSKKYMEEKVGKRIETTFQKYRKNPLSALQDLNRATELGTRVGAFKKAFEKTGDVYSAMQEGREIAADYGVKGKNMSNISPLYPFLNARIQHLKKTGEAIKNNPVKSLAKGITFISAPTLLNWFANNTDDRRRKLYQELPEWRKTGFFNIPISGTDSFLPIPKGFWGTLFGTSVEMTLDHINENDPASIKEYASQLFQELSPMTNPVDIIPQAGRPIVEQFANKKGYTGQPIVSERIKGLQTSEQYYDTTPGIIKSLGSFVGISPARLDAFITAYTAGTGRGAIYITDEILQTIGIVDDKPGDTFATLSNMPITRALVTETPLGTRGESVQKFYSKLDELEEINKQVNNYININETIKLDDYLLGKESDYKFYLKNQTEINKFKNVLRAVRDLRYEIMKDENISDKRDKIKEIEMQVTDVAREFKKAYDNNEKFIIGKSLAKILSDKKQKDKYANKKKKLFKTDYKEVE